MKLKYTQREQSEFREWLELDDRPRNLGLIQIYEHVDRKDGNKHSPVSIDEAGNLFVGNEIALVSKNRIPVTRHNLAWGLSHTPFRQLYGLPKPYSQFIYARSPVDVDDMFNIFGKSVTPDKFWVSYWFSYVLHQREALKRYIARNGRRLKWVGAFEDPDFRKRKSLFLFP